MASSFYITFTIFVLFVLAVIVFMILGCYQSTSTCYKSLFQDPEKNTRRDQIANVQRLLKQTGSNMMANVHLLISKVRKKKGMENLEHEKKKSLDLDRTTKDKKKQEFEDFISKQTTARTTNEKLRQAQAQVESLNKLQSEAQQKLTTAKTSEANAKSQQAELNRLPPGVRNTTGSFEGYFRAGQAEQARINANMQN